MTDIQRSPSRKSPEKTKTRQYRLQITKLTEGQPQGQFFAYCVVSKEASMGLIVHERLLVLNSAKQQLSYYSDIPYLPLRTIEQLGRPKETIKYSEVKKFQFVLERIRIGHVVVRWTEKNQTPRSWKLIMGSNKLAQDFSRLITDTLNHTKTSKLESSENHNSKSSEKRTPYSKEKFASNQTNKIQERSENPKRLPSTSKKNQIRQPMSITTQRKKVEQETQEYFNLNYTSYSIDKQDFKETEPVNIKSYHVLDPLKITDFSEKIPEVKSPTLVTRWIEATKGQQKAAIYELFIDLCRNKVNNLMQNFFATHLQHQQIEGCCLLYDNEIKYMYCPLLDQLQYEENAQTLVQRIKSQQKCFEEWECFNHLSGFDRIGGFKIIVPMACIISYKSVKFYCKTTIDFQNSKTLLTENEVDNILTQLEQKSHIRLRGEERMFMLRDKSIYIDKLSRLPRLPNEMPLTTEYIQRFISKGVIGSERDLQAIQKHIEVDLISEVTDVINQKQISSSFQIAQILKQYGLSHHYLPLIERKARKGYFTRIIISQMVSFAVQWEIRRKMQFELFQKKNFGFACNQVKKSFNSLFQSHQHYLHLIQDIIQGYFKIKYDLQTCPIDTYILGEAVMSEVLFRLGLDCEILVNENQFKGWIWKEENINKNIKLSCFPRIQGYRWGCFSQYPQTFIEKQLFQEINYEIKTETSLQAVFDFLKVKKDKQGSIKLTAEYNLLEPKLRIQVDYYLSHFLVPQTENNPPPFLHSAIYSNCKNLHYNVHSLQYMTSLNEIRWLIKGKHYHQAESLVYENIRKAKIWNQNYSLVQIYALFVQYKLKRGQSKQALELSQRALQAAAYHFQQEHTLLMELLIAQQAYQTANICFEMQQYSMALDFYTRAQKVLKKVTTKGRKISLNPQFLLLYSRKCEIYLLFGEYQNCLDECLQGLQCSAKIRNQNFRLLVDQNQFRLYAVLFRCYDIQKMRKELIEVSEICSHKYFEDRVLINEIIDDEMIGQLIKMIWIGIIKQVQIISPISNPIDKVYHQIKYIYLSKLRKQILNLAKHVNYEQRYTKSESYEYLKARILKKSDERVENRLKSEIILCMVEASTKPLNVWNGKLVSQLGLSSQWAMLETLSCLVGFDFLIGSLQLSLHLYKFQY